MEMSTEPTLAHTSGLGPDQMGLYRSDGDQRGVRGGGYTRQLWWLQQSLHRIRPIPVVVVDTPVAGDIFPAGRSYIYSFEIVKKYNIVITLLVSDAW